MSYRLSICECGVRTLNIRAYELRDCGYSTEFEPAAQQTEQPRHKCTGGSPKQFRRETITY